LSVQKRAKGKLVTVVAGLHEPETDVPALLTQLKNHCGAGGTFRDDIIEIQGHHLDRVRKLLCELGYRVLG
jgi:translation initiation factor 1